MNIDSSYIRKNKISKISQNEYSIKRDNYKLKKKLNYEIYNQIGLLVESNVVENPDNNIIKTLFTYNSKNQLIQEKEFYSDGKIRVNVVNKEKYLDKIKNTIMHRRFWKEYRDTIYNEKKKIIEISDTGYVRGGNKDKYEYDSLERIKNIIHYFKRSNDDIAEYIEFTEHFTYSDIGYKIVETHWFDESQELTHGDFMPMSLNIIIYYFNYSKPIESIICTPSRKVKPKSSVRRDFEYFN